MPGARDPLRATKTLIREGRYLRAGHDRRSPCVPDCGRMGRALREHLGIPPQQSVRAARPIQAYEKMFRGAMTPAAGIP